MGRWPFCLSLIAARWPSKYQMNGIWEKFWRPVWNVFSPSKKQSRPSISNYITINSKPRFLASRLTIGIMIHWSYLTLKWCKDEREFQAKQNPKVLNSQGKAPTTLCMRGGLSAFWPKFAFATPPCQPHSPLLSLMRSQVLFYLLCQTLYTII